MTEFTFNTVGQIVFGEGAIARIGEIAAARLGKRVLVVTDPGLLAAGVVEPALRALAAANVETKVFSDVLAEPPEAVGEAAAAAAGCGRPARSPARCRPTAGC